MQPLVHEVQGLSVDHGAAVEQAVQGYLLPAPVVRGAPVLHELAHVGDRRAVLPARARDLVGEAGPGQPVAQVVEHLVVDVDDEPLDDVRLDRLDRLARLARLAHAFGANSRWSSLSPRSM